MRFGRRWRKVRLVYGIRGELLHDEFFVSLFGWDEVSYIYVSIHNFIVVRLSDDNAVYGRGCVRHGRVYESFWYSHVFTVGIDT